MDSGPATHAFLCSVVYDGTHLAIIPMPGFFPVNAPGHSWATIRRWIHAQERLEFGIKNGELAHHRELLCIGNTMLRCLGYQLWRSCTVLNSKKAVIVSPQDECRVSNQAQCHLRHYRLSSTSALVKTFFPPAPLITTHDHRKRCRACSYVAIQAIIFDASGGL